MAKLEKPEDQRALGEYDAPLVIGSLRYKSPLRIFMLKPHFGSVHTHAL